ncbi:HAD-IA family hydrolase [Olsenella sp. YH-ols2217]|uniref:HAD-IA family hydrolase n=1 Tax=Kribbibacterium absianum TaxID=3044210 RepID=A0ABT6ZIV3_9ACTN|nr:MULTISPECIES: HAD-IA family hydrolase [unclassified Olsenella]MDJ1121249.1 HAD-IA family hydrolase [Olsenella sp. YH-ols2216]MDJ1128739.1 HAD-IA family hydrolase [Olsenella sp. YH-ols2217]
MPESRPIQNVVFDMGGVLLAWEPMQYALTYTGNEPDARLVCDALFCSSTWPLLDAGVISCDTMLTVAHASLPERLWDACDQAFATFPAQQRILTQTNDLGFRLVDAGYRVWLLSNVSIRFRNEFEPRIPLCPVMSGILTSAEEKLMKPDPAIYQRFCETFSVAPETCLFVDDSELNCQGAEKAGWQGFHFTRDCDALLERIRACGAYEV